jgi:uncharacterized repeat protein (TIGR03803 family)
MERRGEAAPTTRAKSSPFPLPVAHPPSSRRSTAPICLTPQAGLTLFGNTLYGTTSDQAGGINFSSTGDGEVFSVPITGGTPTVLASFNGANGDEPYGGLILSGNTLYGTTLGGGANGDGVVFSLTVPEPTTASLLGLASMGLLARRRRCG